MLSFPPLAELSTPSSAVRGLCVPPAPPFKSAWLRMASVTTLLLGLWMVSEPLVAQAGGFTPPKRGIPGRREGGGTRNPFDTLPWRLLVPHTNHGLTQSLQPRVFWLMPKMSVATVELEVLEVPAPDIAQLQSQTKPFRFSQVQGKSVYKASYVPKPGAAPQSIASLAVGQPLSPGRTYFWTVRLKGANAQSVGQAGGWLEVQAPTPSLTTKLGQAKALDRVNLLKDAGLWYDALAEIADQSCKNPARKAQLQQELKALLVQGESQPKSPEAELVKRIGDKDLLCQP
jgi:Domain of Unknown Function (DUF928)